MRKLKEEELAKLESVVENDMLYLVMRDGESSERLFRLPYPSHDQRLEAEALRQLYYWKLKRQGLKTREEVEEEFSDQLKELREDLAGLRAENRKAEYDYIELLGREELPDIEKQSDEFNKRVIELASEVTAIREKIAEVGERVNSIMSNSIDFLARQRYIAALAAMCWEKSEGDKWELMWCSFEEFKKERSALAIKLETEAAKVLLPGAGFFGSLPSQPGGGSDTSRQKTDSDNSLQEV